MFSSPRLRSCVLVAWVMGGLVAVARADEAVPPNGLASTLAAEGGPDSRRQRIEDETGLVPARRVYDGQPTG